MRSKDGNAPHLRASPVDCHREKVSAPACPRPCYPSRSPAGTADEEIAKWDDDAERAMSTVLLHPDERAEKHAQNHRDLVSIWKKLKDIYERRGFLPTAIFGRSSSLSGLLTTTGARTQWRYISTCFAATVSSYEARGPSSLVQLRRRCH